jgi:hypothetical protein
LDPEFKKETEDSYSQHNAGASYDKDGKLGYYDKEDNWKPAPKVDPDDEESKKARKEWEKEKTIAMLNPGEMQKEAMEGGLNKRIKVKKDGDKVVYIEQTKKDGSWVDGAEKTREEALKIQKEHEQAQKAHQISSDIKAAFEEGDDYSKIKSKYPILKDLSDEDFNKIDSAMMDDSEDTAKDKDGNKLVKGEDGKWYKAKEDGTPDTEAGAVSDEDVEIDKKDIKNDDEDGEDFDEDDEDTAKDKDGNKLVKGEDGKWYKAKEDGTPDTEAGAVSDSDVKMDKKKIQNPAKIWHKRKKKNGKGTTKNYYHKNKKGDWESISPKEFKEKMQNYKNKLNSRNNTQTTQQDQNSLSISNFLKDKLIVERFYPRDITNYLREHLR